MAEWLRRGLQILARRFDSGSGLQPNCNTPMLSGGRVQKRRLKHLESPESASKVVRAFAEKKGDLFVKNAITKGQRQWVRPELKKLAAGSAEANASGATEDGGAFGSSRS